MTDTSNVVKFVLPVVKAPKKPWEWLREIADVLEREADDPVMQPPSLVLVTMNYDKTGDGYRIRADRHECRKVEAIGMLHTAAHDYNAD